MEITKSRLNKNFKLFLTAKTKEEETSLINSHAVYLKVAVYRGIREFISNPYRATSDPPPHANRSVKRHRN